MSVALKHSYTVPCSSAFRAAVEALAELRQVNAGDLARSVLLVVPGTVVEQFEDPGEPPSHDRETVILKSGPASGRPWRRKPRLQVRMPPGFSIPFIRRALGLALALSEGRLEVVLSDPSLPPPAPLPAPEPVPERLIIVEADIEEEEDAESERDRLRAIISALMFEPFPDGIRTRTEALHVLGFAPSAKPDSRMVKAKFRLLATIHHPDSDLGSHQRMSQLNQAMELLRNG
jgi:hypothetical protein